MNRLYESILPLMPWYGTASIYYCSCTPERKQLGIYCYSMRSKQSQLCIQDNHSLLMPTVVDHMLLYGGLTSENDVIKVLQIDPSNC